MMVELIEEMKEKALAPHKFEAEEAAARETAIDYLLESVPQQDASSYLGATFKAADSDNDGVLTRAQFHASLVQLDLGLTQGEVTYLAAEREGDNGGQLCYDLFVSEIFDMLIDVVAGALLEASGRFVYWQNQLVRGCGVSCWLLIADCCTGETLCSN